MRIRVLAMSLFALLLVWGGFVTISYFGIPVHGRVLISEAGWNFVLQVAGADAVLTRGIAALLPSLFNTIGRSAPFAWYVGVLCCIALGYMGWQGYKYGDVRLDLELKPWHILAAFVASLWLLFTVLTSVEYPQGDRYISLRRLIEPHPSVYTSDNIEGLDTLQSNFENLLNRGCLRQIGTIRQDVGEYQIKMRCVQQSFFTVVLPQLFFQLVLVLVFLAGGRKMLRLFRLQLSDGFQEMVMSLGVGVCVQITLLWLLALGGFFTASAGWLLLALTIAVSYRDARYWLTRFLYDTFPLRRSWYSFTLLCGLLLLTWFAFNFLTVMRPFPIGWDDLGSYLNRPRLLVSYGSFISDMSTFQWEYLSALGYLLFGYNSIFGSTAAMTINWLAGVLATLAVMAFARRYLGGSGVISGLLYYSLPLVGHFSFADMKTDNAVFVLQALSIFAVFIYLFPGVTDTDETSVPRSRMWLFVAGLLCAFAFGTKATAVMTLFTLAALLAGVLAHWSASIAVIAAAFAVLTYNTLSIPELAARVGWPFLTLHVFLTICGAVVFVAVGYTFFRASRRAGPALISLCVLAGGFLLGVAPWLLHNNVVAGNVVPKLVLEAPNVLKPLFFFDGKEHPEYPTARALPAELAIDPNHQACKGTGRDEELGRYWGNHEGWGHYLTLPWRSVMNLDSVGYYVTTSPVVLLFPLLLLLPFFWSDRGRWLRWLWIGTAILIMQWVFLANGVPWYGIAMFLGLCVGLEALVVRAPDSLNRSAVVTLLIISLVSCYGMRVWQFEQQKNLLEYPMGKASAEVMRERTIPYYDDVIDVLTQQRRDLPDRPYLYRIGTFIPYFIPRNDEVIGIVDHQLDEFRCLHQEQDDALTLQRLRALGFNSIIFDTNAATIEQDPDGPLHQKVQDFVDFLNNQSLGLRVIVNDLEAGLAFVLIP
jgi:hypothetical protein